MTTNKLDPDSEYLYDFENPVPKRGVSTWMFFLQVQRPLMLVII